MTPSAKVAVKGPKRHVKQQKVSAGVDYFDALGECSGGATQPESKTQCNKIILSTGIEDLLCLVFVHTDKLSDSRGSNEN